MDTRLTFADTEWMRHADRIHLNHEMARGIADAEVRGTGAKLRLYGCGPQTAARLRGDTALSYAIDKPHSLRAAHIVDPDGYVQAPSRAFDRD